MSQRHTQRTSMKQIGRKREIYRKAYREKQRTSKKQKGGKIGRQTDKADGHVDRQTNIKTPIDGKTDRQAHRPRKVYKYNTKLKVTVGDKHSSFHISTIGKF